MLVSIPFFSFDWFALVMYFIETIFKLLAVMFDVAYDVAPVIEGQFSDESLKGGIVILSGFRLAFHSRVVYFFWNKIFHGDKDLFSEPCSKVRVCLHDPSLPEGMKGGIILMY